MPSAVAVLLVNAEILASVAKRLNPRRAAIIQCALV